MQRATEKRRLIINKGQRTLKTQPRQPEAKNMRLNGFKQLAGRVQPLLVLQTLCGTQFFSCNPK
jgi:hypothetical protein